LKEGTFRLLHPEATRLEFTISSFKNIGHGKWLALFLLAAGAGFAHPPIVGAQSLTARFPAPILTMAAAQQTGTAAETTSVSMTGTAAIQAAVAGVHSPSPQALARALGMTPAQIGQKVFEDSDIGMEALNSLGNGGASAVAVKWRPADQGQNPEAGEGPKLYLLSWEGEGWQASYLMPASDALTMQALPVTGDTEPLFAVVIYRGTAAVPYPVIFRLQNHQASLVWDGRSDSASYSGYDYGSIQFEKTGGGGVPVMLVAGQADPGLLIFPASQEQSGRGFQVATAYIWKNDAYLPIRTEYTHNRDYVLYSFIAALHLHDFKTAYSLIDPAQFLKTKKPTLKLFRERIESVWPEFIDDRIFEVPFPARPEIEPESHIFVLRLRGGRMNGYRPTFTPGPDYRLTGLSRFERRQ
jgi:hypothetical protein